MQQIKHFSSSVPDLKVFSRALSEKYHCLSVSVVSNRRASTNIHKYIQAKTDTNTFVMKHQFQEISKDFHREVKYLFLFLIHGNVVLILPGWFKPVWVSSDQFRMELELGFGNAVDS